MGLAPKLAKPGHCSIEARHRTSEGPVPSHHGNVGYVAPLNLNGQGRPGLTEAPSMRGAPRAKHNAPAPQSESEATVKVLVTPSMRTSQHLGRRGNKRRDCEARAHTQYLGAEALAPGPRPTLGICRNSGTGPVCGLGALVPGLPKSGTGRGPRFSSGEGPSGH